MERFVSASRGASPAAGDVRLAEVQNGKLGKTSQNLESGVADVRTTQDESRELRKPFQTRKLNVGDERSGNLQKLKLTEFLNMRQNRSRL